MFTDTMTFTTVLADLGVLFGVALMAVLAIAPIMLEAAARREDSETVEATPARFTRPVRVVTHGSTALA